MLGAVATVATRTEPGRVLGASVVVGTVVAGLAVRPRAGRMIFPVPSLSYLIAALTAGIVYDRSADSSKTALAIGATQWIANGFFAMVLATALAIVLTVVRWFIWRRSRRVPAASGRPARAAGNSRRPQAGTEELPRFGIPGDVPGPGGWNDPGSQATTQRLPRPPQGQWRPGAPGAQGPDRRSGQFPKQGHSRRRDLRPDPRPGSGPYNFSSGA